LHSHRAHVGEQHHRALPDQGVEEPDRGVGLALLLQQDLELARDRGQRFPGLIGG
jgi:hypothetical protein